MDPKREAAIETARAMTDVILDETLSIDQKNQRLEALGDEFRKKRREIEGGDPPGRGFTAAIGNNTMENKLVMGEGLASLLESKHACLKIEIVDGPTTGEEENNHGPPPAQTGP